MDRVLICFVPTDQGLATALAFEPSFFGLGVVAAAWDPAAGRLVPRDPAQNVGGEFRVMLLLWSQAAAADARFAELFAGTRAVLLRRDATPVPAALAASAVLDLHDWLPRRGAGLPPALRALVGLQPKMTGAPGDPFADFKAPAPVATAPRRVGGSPPPADPFSGLPPATGSLDALLGGGGRSPAPPAGGMDPFGDPPPPPQPVQLAAAAPRRSAPGARFTAALVTHIASERDAALRLLADLGEPDDRRVGDLPAGVWAIGAPVIVRMVGSGFTSSPDRIAFAWSGRRDLAAFAVEVAADAAADLVLAFQVCVADVPVAHVPMRVAIATGTAPAAPEHHHTLPAPGSAFASYASRDAQPVAQKLSALARWAPGLDIFQDCLDLKPGEDFKAQLARQIAARDVFLLFWSRHAAASPWVRWELDTALARRGPQAVLPMPLEDPSLAPPPPELADRHLRDRFLVAGLAAAAVQAQHRSD